MWIMNPGYINPLFSTTLGNIFLGAGVVMATIGMIWMKKVITINV
jgi:Flp pilus assembly protein TadB